MDKIAKVLFIVPPKVHLLDISGPAHIFYEAAEYGAPFQSFFVSLDQNVTTVTSSSGLAFSELEAFTSFELTSEDLIFVPGLDAHLLLDTNFLKATRPFQVWLKKQLENGASVCSVCTGAFLLAETGILANKECTTHWKYIDQFQHRYPEALLQKNRLFVDAENVLSSAGVASGIDLALYLIEKKVGSQFAARIAREVVIYLRRMDSDPQLSVFLQYRNHIDDKVHKVQDLLAQSLHTKLTIEELAEDVHVSPRNLTRIFKKATQITIGQYLDKLRVERAVKLIGEGHKVSAVASECGLHSENQLRNLLGKHKGILPSDLRELA